MVIPGVPLLQQIPYDTIVKVCREEKGRLSHASKRLGITHHALLNLMNNKPEFRKEVETMRREAAEKEIDICESRLETIMDMVNERPEIALKAIRFYMECQGKNRGYGLTQDRQNEEAVSGALSMIRAIRVAGGEGKIEVGGKREEEPVLIEAKVERIEGKKEEEVGDIVIRRMNKRKADRVKREFKKSGESIKKEGEKKSIFNASEFREGGKKWIK